MRSVITAIRTVLVLGMRLGAIAFLTACHDPSHDIAMEQPVPHARESNFTLATDGLASTVSLPHLSVFDQKGHLILDLKSYRDDLSKLLRGATKEPKPLNGGRVLTEEVSHVWTSSRRPPVMSDLGDFDFVYEAEWCVPCKAQLKDLRVFVEANPKIRINLVRVEVGARVSDADK